jgi:DnaJ-like protein
MASNQRPINYYDILGVPPTAVTEAIHAAYRSRIAEYHPDRNRSAHAHAYSALINEAWAVLGDSVRRHQYDAFMGFEGKQDRTWQQSSSGTSGTRPPPPDDDSPPPPPPPGSDNEPEASAPSPDTRRFSVASVSLGWKLYILSCAWVGIVVGVSNESLIATIILWAVGASVAWLLAPAIRHEGWRRIVTVGSVSVAGLVALGLVVGNWQTVAPWLAVPFLIGLVRAVQTFLSHRAARQPEPSPKTVESCPQCGTVKPWVKRKSDGAVACWKCGHRQSESDTGSESAAATQTPHVKLVGVRGWLAVFAYSLTFLAPVLAYVALNAETTKAKTTSEVAGACVVTGLMTAFGMFAGIGLLARWPDAPRTAQRYLLWSVVGMLALCAFIAIFGLMTPAEIAQSIGSVPFASLLWYVYFAKSKRVEATYRASATTSPRIRRSTAAGISVAASLLMCIVAAAGFHDPATAQWLMYQSKVGAFSIDAPGPGIEKFTPSTNTNPATTVVDFQRGRQEFVVTYFDLSRENQDLDNVYDRVQSNFIGAVKATLTGSGPIAWRVSTHSARWGESHPGRTFTGTVANASSHMEGRIFWIGERIFTLLVSTPNGSPETAASRFLDSFDVPPGADPGPAASTMPQKSGISEPQPENTSVGRGGDERVIKGKERSAQSPKGPATTAPASQAGDDAYWAEVGRRVVQYMKQKAGTQYTKEVFDGFVTWLGSAPDVLQQYDDGDDKKREALVDQYLTKVLVHPDPPVQTKASLVGRYQFVGSVTGRTENSRATLLLTLANDSTITGRLTINGVVDQQEVVGEWKQDGRLSLRLPEINVDDGGHVRPTMIGNFDGQKFEGTLEVQAKQPVSGSFRFSVTAK